MTKDQVYYQKNRTEVRARQREYYMRTHEEKRAYQRAYYADNRERIGQYNRDRRKKMRAKYAIVKKAWRLRHDYGITLAEHEAQRIKQDNLCLICQQPLSKSPATDHCHKTGKFRGLLCHACNRGIGFLKEDVTVLKRAIQYLS